MILYSEKIVYSAQQLISVNDTKAFTLADRDLHACGDWDCHQRALCFVALTIITKLRLDVFDCWMRILKQVEDSVLWLLEDNATAAS